MTHKKSKTVIASAVSLALASMMLAGGAYAGRDSTIPTRPLARRSGVAEQPRRRRRVVSGRWI